MTQNKKKKKSKKQKLTNEQKEQKKKDQAIAKMKRDYSKSIHDIFSFSGFTTINVKDKTFEMGNKKIELDHCFVLENILVICEDTCGQNDQSAHLLRKKESADIILKDSSSQEAFIEILKGEGYNFKTDHHPGRFKINFLYFSKFNLDLNDNDLERFSPLKVVDTKTYNYFINMSKSIKKSFRYEILNYLNISANEFGPQKKSTSSDIQDYHPIIFPNETTGYNNGVQIVSFMLTPQELIKYSYVLRKDSWDEKIGLYQRLIKPSRINNIRRYVIDNTKTFLNNIIIGLPDKVRIVDESENEVSISNINSSHTYKISLPTTFNSYSIIDGQHRVYAYYENDVDNEEEKEVSKLRDKLNLLVTGIKYPSDWDEIRRRTFESEIFLDINKNAKSVDKDLLIHIEATKDPLSSQAIARKVLEKLNSTNSPFKGLLELSLVEKAPIKVASIIQYALRSLVSPTQSAESLYPKWIQKEQKEESHEITTKDLESYINYCSNILRIYFSAIRKSFMQYWTTDNKVKSSLLKIVSINGFIIGLGKVLVRVPDLEDFNYYERIFSASGLSFSKDSFQYAGSRYSQFAQEKIVPLFPNNIISED